jgi:predicted Rossmann fold nucleotide-binding protein DprA/Smf involved in DNA uptake
MKKLMKELTSISKMLSALSEKLVQLSSIIGKEDVQVKPEEKTAKKRAAPKVKVAKKAAPPKKATAKKAAKKAAPKEVTPKPVEPTATSDIGLLDNIYGLISAEGTTVAEIKEKSGLSPRQVSNALYKLTKKGMIDTKSRGVYVKK